MKTKLAGMGGAPAQTYVDDVFSTYLYTGNGSTQTITNGIDLAGKGGMVWIKQRGGTGWHMVYDTERGVNKYINTNTGGQQDASQTGHLTSFNSNGFTLGSQSDDNQNGITTASWTFRKAAKFFDVVTYTGDGTGVRAIPHSLGIGAGMAILKKVSVTSNWIVAHNSNFAKPLYLNSTAADDAFNQTGIFDCTESAFYVGATTGSPNFGSNDSGVTYVAYLFAHDTSSTGIIQCGSFMSTGNVQDISLGWEPQYLMVKRTDSADDWYVEDVMRGMTTNRDYALLYPNLNSPELVGAGSPSTPSSGFAAPTATGFQFPARTPGRNYIYMAIRRPNKPPTSGTQVFGLNARTGTGANATVTGGQTDDAVLIKNRGAAVADLFSSRLTGINYLETSSTAAEVVPPNLTILQSNPWDVMDGVKVGTTSTITNASANTFINYFFKRAPGFFDEVCYTGTGVAATQAHNLGAVPELMIVKNRTGTGRNWAVYTASTGVNALGLLDLTNAFSFGVSNYWDTLPTSSVFSIGTEGRVNLSGNTYVAYLFATLAGIQYINSYVGDGTTGRVINCGFSAGARFICIKATSTTGSWWVWDSARGITSTNDPALQLNSTAAEITSADAIDPSSSGFIVNQEATCSINASGVSYLVWAIA